jgi:hypothetical protein
VLQLPAVQQQLLLPLCCRLVQLLPQELLRCEAWQLLLVLLLAVAPGQEQQQQLLQLLPLQRQLPFHLQQLADQPAAAAAAAGLQKKHP